MKIGQGFSFELGVRPTLKKLFVSYHLDRKKNVTRAIIANYKVNHNCNVNLNWKNRQFYSSAKPLRNVPSSVFWFVHFCFLPFLRRISLQKWKKNWLCYVQNWIGKKEKSAKISKCLCQNLFIGAAAQIRAMYKVHEILVTLIRCITLSLSF